MVNMKKVAFKTKSGKKISFMAGRHGLAMLCATKKRKCSAKAKKSGWNLGKSAKVAASRRMLAKASKTCRRGGKKYFSKAHGACVAAYFKQHR